MRLHATVSISAVHGFNGAKDDASGDWFYSHIGCSIRNYFILQVQRLNIIKMCHKLTQYPRRKITIKTHLQHENIFHTCFPTLPRRFHPPSEWNNRSRVYALTSALVGPIHWWWCWCTSRAPNMDTLFIEASVFASGMSLPLICQNKLCTSKETYCD